MDWQQHVTKFHLTGSTAMGLPGNDIDFICYAENWQASVTALSSIGFDIGGSCPASEVEWEMRVNAFVSLKREDLNLIVTPDFEFYRRFQAATYIMKLFRPEVKKQRIELFQAVLYGNSPESADPILISNQT